MKKPTATRQKEKTEIEQLSQAEGVEMVLALQKIIEELQEKLAIAIATIRSVLDRLSVHKEDFVYRDRSAGTKGFNKKGTIWNCNLY